MRRTLVPLALAAGLAAGPLQAACYADYKARQDAPLKLHYGVIELPDAACDDPGAARDEIARRIARDGWTLLTVLSTFDESGLEKRKANADGYFLRY